MNDLQRDKGERQYTFDYVQLCSSFWLPLLTCESSNQRCVYELSFSVKEVGIFSFDGCFASIQEEVVEN